MHHRVIYVLYDSVYRLHIIPFVGWLVGYFEASQIDYKTYTNVTEDIYKERENLKKK